MRKYEIAIIIHPDLDEAAFTETVDRVKGWITEAGGTIENVDLWGKRRLAYEIRKQREGQYVIMKTEMLPAFCSELERNLRLQEPVMRFMVTNALEVAPAPVAPAPVEEAVAPVEAAPVETAPVEEAVAPVEAAPEAAAPATPAPDTDTKE